jgi:hypothetical protein
MGGITRTSRAVHLRRFCRETGPVEVAAGQRWKSTVVVRR